MTNQIEVNKYEGHTEGPWHIENEENNGMRLFICSKDATILWQCETTHADTLLVADAPLLLEEVKRLRAWKKLVSDIVQQQDGSHLREMLKELIE